jgi:hypothetical protein
MQRQHQASSAAASRLNTSGRIASYTHSTQPFDSTTSTSAVALPNRTIGPCDGNAGRGTCDVAYLPVVASSTQMAARWAMTGLLNKSYLDGRKAA